MIAATIGYHLLRRPELALVVVNLAMEVLALEEPITRSPAGKSGGAISCLHNWKLGVRYKGQERRTNMNTIDHDATDAELIDALLTHHIAPALDALDLAPFETPDPRANELIVVIDAINHVYARVTVDIIRN